MDISAQDFVSSDNCDFIAETIEIMQALYKYVRGASGYMYMFMVCLKYFNPLYSQYYSLENLWILKLWSWLPRGGVSGLKKKQTN